MWGIAVVIIVIVFINRRVLRKKYLENGILFNIIYVNIKHNIMLLLTG